MYAGCDLSSSPIRAVLLDDEGRLVSRATEEASVECDPAEAGRRLRAALGDGAASVQAVGVATCLPGDDLERASAVAFAWSGREPVLVPAGGALAVAEARAGAAAGAADVAAFAIGTHVTAGLVSEGQLWTGARGLAGSVGWLALNPVERDDYRRHGGLEAEVSADGIVRRLIWRVKAGDHSAAVDRVGGDFAALTAAHVVETARAGDGVAISVMRDTARYAGMAVANLAAVADPDIVILGGLLVSAGDLLLEPVRTEARRRLGPLQAPVLRIEPAALGEDAVAIGAAHLARTGGR